MRRLKPGKNNKEDRMNFVKYWANYVRTHSDEDWSRQQKVIIDSQIMNSKNFKLDAKKYLKIKGELR